jgi:hypothetical protein
MYIWEYFFASFPQHHCWESWLSSKVMIFKSMHNFIAIEYLIDHLDWVHNELDCAWSILLIVCFDCLDRIFWSGDPRRNWSIWSSICPDIITVKRLDCSCNNNCNHTSCITTTGESLWSTETVVFLTSPCNRCPDCISTIGHLISSSTVV